MRKKEKEKMEKMSNKSTNLLMRCCDCLCGGLPRGFSQVEILQSLKMRCHCGE